MLRVGSIRRRGTGAYSWVALLTALAGLAAVLAPAHSVAPTIRLS